MSFLLLLISWPINGKDSIPVPLHGPGLLVENNLGLDLARFVLLFIFVIPCGFFSFFFLFVFEKFNGSFQAEGYLSLENICLLSLRKVWSLILC